MYFNTFSAVDPAVIPYPMAYIFVPSLLASSALSLASLIEFGSPSLITKIYFCASLSLIVSNFACALSIADDKFVPPTGCPNSLETYPPCLNSVASLADVANVTTLAYV